MIKSSIKIISVVIFCCIALFARGQFPLDNLDACSFSICNESDTIQFIKINRDLGTPKPTVVFFQGSLPIPLVIKFSDDDLMIPSINNFDYKKIAQKYNIVIISMPGVPLIAGGEKLNNQFAFITDKKNEHSFPKRYIENDYFEKYVERGNTVINFLVKQSWVDKKRLILVGHSQGARIAAGIAAHNHDVAVLGFLSGDPLGRITQYIRKVRWMERMGKLPEVQAQDKINEIYNWWKELNANLRETSISEQDNPRTIISFSKSMITNLVTTSIPIYIAYGTKDVNAEYCDLLPIDFIQAGKQNYKISPFLGLEHNFMEVDSIGNPIPERCHWDRVINDFLNWEESQQYP
ncbi:MAG: hypothetical protein Q8R96_09095 [Bacteroidota bacterium]|nr:hypothetical protein [Bacteroidota bacterium]